jgi:Uma2 family endonuclease
VSATPEQRRVRFTTAEYERMGSILGDRRTELIDGEIIEMAAIGTAHLVVVDRLERTLVGLKAVGRLQSSQPLRLGERDEPQPDLMVLRQSLELHKPSAADCLLVIEVTDSTYDADRARKVPRYLGAGMPEVWLVNISDYDHPVLEVHAPGVEERRLTAGEVWVEDIAVSLERLFAGLAGLPRDE